MPFNLAAFMQFIAFAPLAATPAPPIAPADPVPARPLPPIDPSPEQALQAYVRGLRSGDLAELERLFLPEGQFCTLSEAPPATAACRPFAEVLPGWVAAPDPTAAGRVVERVDATPRMSAITYELRFGGDRYIDQLLLYRTDAGWRVVAKTTAVR
ncbi:nuclear transport factor 2 family protein [Sphingopyxis sp.]|jgi:hypothetical protein|uniref:nuclear transport factor 2 family protein n=1 Tax=Sphingopyxis sp. TaxID=1908224 RepID=UPI002E08CA99|nr:nuclear transport factor 2 family protein [Sphingopyxis sp.]